MIFEALTSVAIVIFNGIVSLFPAVDTATQANIASFYTEFRGTLGNIAWIFPTDTAFQVMTMFITVEVSIFTFKIIRWIINFVAGGIVKA